MRTFLVLLVLCMTLTGYAQQVRLDPTGDGESLLATTYVVLAPDVHLFAGSSSTAPSYIEKAWAAQLVGSNTIWSQNFGENSRFTPSARTQSGHVILAGYIIVSGNTEGLLVCLNPATGMVVWSRTIGTAEADMFEAVAEHPDGTLWVAGTRGSTATNRQWVLLNVASDGSLISAKQQPNAPSSQLVKRIVIKSDSILVLGTEKTSSSGSRNPAIRAFNSSGNEILHRTYGTLGTDDNAVDLAIDDAGGYMLATSIPSIGDVGTIRLDGNLDTVSNGTQSLWSVGYTLSGGKLVSDPALGSNFYSNFSISDGTSSLALAAHLDPGPDWLTTFSGGFGDTRPGIDGVNLNMLAATVSSDSLSNGLTLVPIDPLGPSIVCGSLPGISLESSPYPSLAQTNWAVDPNAWFDPGFIESPGPEAVNLTISLSDPCNPFSLPIELGSFTARPENQSVHLDWVTASEQDNDFFTVERSVDGQVFESVARVLGAGNSLSEIAYNAIDEDPYIGRSYYRLKQTDFDGESAFSNVVPVEVGERLALFPNPLASGGVLRGIPTDEKFEVIGSLRQVVFEGSGETVINLLPGVYTLRLKDDPKRASRLVVTNN